MAGFDGIWQFDELSFKDTNFETEQERYEIRSIRYEISSMTAAQ